MQRRKRCPRRTRSPMGRTLFAAAAVMLLAVAAQAVPSVHGRTAAAGEWPVNVEAAASVHRAMQGGVRWELQRTPTEYTLYDIDFVGDRLGWAVGGEGESNEKDVAIRTVDGGASWSLLDVPGARRLQSVSFVSPDVGWIVGDFGQVYRTGDGGATWQPLDAGTDIRLTSVEFIDERTGWMTGRDTVVFKTTDGGASWTRYESDADGHLSRVFFLDETLGWVLGGDGEILHSADGGQSWDHQDIPTDRRLYGVVFADPLHGWTAGSDIFGTQDGGVTWLEQSEPRKSQRDIAFADANVGWSVGDEGVVVHTTNGGASWEEESHGLTRSSLNAVAIADRAHLWACGVKGTVLHRTDEAAAVTPTATSTHTPTATRTPTPAPTSTPEGPWIDLGGPSETLLVPPGSTLRVVARFGNMPSSVVITGTLTGAAVFDDGEQAFTDTVLRLDGAGDYPFTVQPAPGAVHGAAFDLSVRMASASATRRGAVAWPLHLPWGSR